MEINLIDSLMIAGSGLLTVFILLALLQLAILLNSQIFLKLEARKKQRETINVNIPQAPVPVSQDATVWTGTVDLIDVDEKTAACIIAIVSEESKIPLNELIVKRIKAL